MERRPQARRGLAGDAGAPGQKAAGAAGVAAAFAGMTVRAKSIGAGLDTGSAAVCQPKAGRRREMVCI